MSILKQARELISDPAHWTKGCNAQNKDGEQCGSYGNEPVKWCAHGAICRLTWTDIFAERPALAAIKNRAMDLLRTVARNKGFESFTVLNDQSTHEEVMAMFDEAIKMEAEGNGQ